MATDSEHARQSIMIALDPGAPGRASLEVVGCLVDHRGRHLLGVAIEDAELLALARSRLATEVVLSGAARPLERSRLERQLRAQSAAIRRTFETEAARLGYSYAFKVLHGSVAARLRDEAVAAEMLVVELPSPFASHQAAWSARIDQLAETDLPAVLYARLGAAKRKGLVALVEEAGDLETIVRMAGSLARGGALAPTVLLGERSHVAEHDVRTALESALQEQSVHLRLVRSATIEAVSLSQITQASDARILVVPGRITRADPRFVRELLRRTSCSILLVNPAR
jgi:hypothetical protein